MNNIIKYFILIEDHAGLAQTLITAGSDMWASRAVTIFLAENLRPGLRVRLLEHDRELLNLAASQKLSPTEYAAAMQLVTAPIVTAGDAGPHRQ
ncbi:MAG: hypothetical protein L0331_05840 [Chloroflexi bacterium]|nr:hypothetical protein [Chloroflexota bacterium]